ncbi:MAG: hypothetical protein LBN38_05775 [Verrucomicrobiota bacterium]|jgi:hypothetical protein|nr:hypothetical protein [Verrucomicrobiota bacterium]
MLRHTFQPWRFRKTGFFFHRNALLLSGLAVASILCAPAAAHSEPYAYTPRAHIETVEKTFIVARSADIPGAGVRFFQTSEPLNIGTERFEIRWYANPPGIPPGVVVMLETVAEHRPSVKNHTVQLRQKSEGHIQSVFELSREDMAQAGRVRQWRARIIWRGRLLASQASENWGY